VGSIGNDETTKQKENRNTITSLDSHSEPKPLSFYLTRIEFIWNAFRTSVAF